MKSLRYTVTRPCLQEGSLRLLKYLESTFAQSGPVVFVDDKAKEHTVQVDTEQGRVWGLHGLYHDQNLGVNDVLILTMLAPGRYQVEAVVKPHAPQPAPRREVRPQPETRRVVVASTPHVREVRVQEVPAIIPALNGGVNGTASSAASAAPRVSDAPDITSSTPNLAAASSLEALKTIPFEARISESRPEPRPEVRPEVRPERRAPEDVRPAPSGNLGAVSRPLDVRFETVAPAPATLPRLPRTAPTGPVPNDAEGQLSELARLTGYRLEDLGGGVNRLKAELGPHGYAVLIANQPDALRSAAWQQEAEYRLLLTAEDERPEGVARLTRDALVALIEHARLAPLSPVDLRGYWKAGSVDLESAASVAEMVASHLAQRGAFSFVLLTLSQQPPHSVISVPRLAERLGSGVNFAELGSILDTLTRPPFLALTPLPGGQYLLRVGVADLLTDLAEYADGVRRRVRTPAQRENVLV